MFYRIKLSISHSHIHYQSYHKSCHYLSVGSKFTKHPIQLHRTNFGYNISEIIPNQMALMCPNEYQNGNYSYGISYQVRGTNL